jgi:uncharacterized protein
VSRRNPAPSAGSTPRRALLVFVRAPREGTVKTRLAASIGDAAALGIYRRLAEHTLAVARGAGSGIDLRVLHAPDDAGAEVGAWLGEGPRFLPQGDGDLGTRMERAFTGAFADGADRAIVVGTDLPGITSDLILAAFELLERSEVVIGPADDGGYYLLGLRRLVPGLFAGVPWSTPAVLATTLRRLAAEGIVPGLLERHRDVDVVEDIPRGWHDDPGGSGPEPGRRG